MPEVTLVNVFAAEEGGGNPTPIVLDASAYDEARMFEVTRSYGLESTFVVPPTNPGEADFRFRFFVPRQEMDMCGHATVGTLWLLRRVGRFTRSQARIETGSGMVRGFVQAAGTPGEYVEITQPAGRLEEITSPEARQAMLHVLGIGEAELSPLPIYNAVTSRMKTLIPVKSPEILDGLEPDFPRMEALCTALQSTGLYPFAVHSLPDRLFDARQFPRASGFPEDAATGVAATALAFGLVAYGLIPCDEKRITVHQGRAMGRPSEIFVRFDFPEGGSHPRACFLGGRAVLPANQP
ncbi:MAG TPA: PhzF family phenazine biosynthesis protein [Candidatus Methylomirabilis sp.]|nr:PhzF family phenazine biosynthesis protein [Candidatus Methylomirabilis sp.]